MFPEPFPSGTFYVQFYVQPGQNLSTTKLQLDYLQRMICIALIGAMRTTPTAAIETLL